MTSTAPTVESLIAEVRSGFESAAPLDRLARAIELSGDRGELGEHVAGYFAGEARRAGVPWAAIGARLGVSRQAVQRRFVPRTSRVRHDRFWDRATDALKNTVSAAAESARAGRGIYLGTEHLLLALAGQPGDPACRALASCGAGPAAIRSAVNGRSSGPPGYPLPADTRSTRRETPYTRQALRSLRRARREAAAMNHASIDCPHLALALMAVTEGVAHDILVGLGVSYGALREAVAAVTSPERAARAVRAVRAVPGGVTA